MYEISKQFQSTEIVKYDGGTITSAFHLGFMNSQSTFQLNYALNQGFSGFLSLAQTNEYNFPKTKE